MDKVVWAELYRILERLEGDALRLREHVDSAGNHRLQHLQNDIQQCAALVQGLLKGTPSSAAYMRLVGLSGD